MPKLPDWLMQAQEERRILYRAYRQLIDETKIEWPEIWKKALGLNEAGTGFIDNFRSGKISRRHAASMYRWLRMNYPDRASHVDNEIATLYPGAERESGWEALIAEHGLFDGLRLQEICMQEQRQVQMMSGPTEPPPVYYPAYQRFLIEFLSPIAGYALQFQWARGGWSALPTREQSSGCPVKIGPNSFPAGQHYYIENTDTGLRRFAVLVVPPDLGAEIETAVPDDNTLPLHVLNDIAERVLATDHDTWSIARINVMFEGYYRRATE